MAHLKKYAPNQAGWNVLHALTPKQQAVHADVITISSA